MIFQICKTSDWNAPNAVKPCENAFKINMNIVEKRYFGSPSSFNNYTKQNWYDKGTNHRIIGGCIARNIGKKTVWGIELNTLEDLINLQKSVDKEIIIGVSDDDYETLCLEIYNTYRE